MLRAYFPWRHDGLSAFFAILLTNAAQRLRGCHAVSILRILDTIPYLTTVRPL